MEEELASNPVTRWYALLSVGGQSWSAWAKVQPEKEAFIGALMSPQCADVDVWERIVRRWIHRASTSYPPPKLNVFLKAAGSDLAPLVVVWVGQYRAALNNPGTPFPLSFEEAVR